MFAVSYDYRYSSNCFKHTFSGFTLQIFPLSFLGEHKNSSAIASIKGKSGRASWLQYACQLCSGGKHGKEHR